MSPAPKSKAKTSPKVTKEHQKPSASSAPSNGGNAQATTSDPSSTASLSLETTQLAPSHPSRLLVVSETEEQSNYSMCAKTEYDSVSNNGSCSGESEDQKEKAPATTPQPETIPGGDSDKRDKIRQKNERKHQRQKERRAQELQERCTSILMTRKLDVLTQQFVAMGFSAERATRALILNEGRVEDSVSWLLEGGAVAEQNDEAKKDGALNMKIDISDELAKMAEMEVKFKCLKQVQRAVVSCEGDLDKAMETLNAQQKQNAPSTPPSIKIPAVNGMNRGAMQQLQAVVTTKPASSAAIQKLRREERDPNHPKATTMVVGQTSSPDPRNVMLQSSLKAQPKSDWAKNQTVTQIDRRWPNAATGPFSYPMTSSSLQAVALPTKAETRHAAVGGEASSRLGLHPGSMREPIVVMQRPQLMNVKHQQPSTSAGLNVQQPQLTTTAGWESTRLSATDAAAKIANGGLVQRHPNMSQTTGSLLNPNSQPFLHPDRNRHSFVSSSSDIDAAAWSGVGGNSWSTGRPSGQPSSLTNMSSLGIFTGWGSSSGSSGSSSPVDWSTGGLIPQLDYTRVDWSLDSTPLAFDDLQAPASGHFYEAWLNQLDSSNRRNSSRSAAFPRGNRFARFAENTSLLSADPINTVLSPDWTSPFAGKDIFRLPRQIVTSPTP